MCGNKSVQYTRCSIPQVDRFRGGDISRNLVDYLSSLASHLQNRPDENSVGKGSLPHSNQKKNVTLNTDQAIASSSVDMGGVLASIFGGIIIF